MASPRSRPGWRGGLALLGLAGIALALPWLGRWLGDEREARMAEAAPPPEVAAAPPVLPSAAAARELVANEQPGSLQGTTPDGDVRVDAAGHLVPGPELLRLFEHFLAAAGEEPLATIRARIAGELHRRVRDPATSEALALLDRFFAYRDAMQALTDEGAAPAELERRLQWIRELRRAHFGAELAAQLFGEEERTTELDLERRRVLLEPGLTEPQRRARLDAIEARLPEAVRETRRAASLPMRLRAEVEEMRAAGASEEDVFRLREQAVGHEAATRLSALDRERAAWQSRLAAWRETRDAFLAANPDPGAARGVELARLRAERFDEHERMRVRALDEIDLAASGAVAEVPAEHERE